MLNLTCREDCIFITGGQGELYYTPLNILYKIQRFIDHARPGHNNKLNICLLGVCPKLEQKTRIFMMRSKPYSFNGRSR